MINSYFLCLCLCLCLCACGSFDSGGGGGGGGQPGTEHLYAVGAGLAGGDLDLGPWLGGTIAQHSTLGALDFSASATGARLYYSSADCSGQGYFVRPGDVVDTATNPPTPYGGGAISSQLGVAGGVIFTETAPGSSTGSILGRDASVTGSILPASFAEHAGGYRWTCNTVTLPATVRAAGAGGTLTGRSSPRYGNLAVRRIVP